MNYNNFSDFFSNLIPENNDQSSFDRGIFDIVEKINDEIRESNSAFFGEILTWRFKIRNGIVNVYDGNGNLFESEEIALDYARKQDNNLINFNNLPNYYSVLRTKKIAQFFNNLNIDKRANFRFFDNLYQINKEIQKFNFTVYDEEVLFLIDINKKKIFYNYLQELYKQKTNIKNFNKYKIENIPNPSRFNIKNFENPNYGIQKIIDFLNLENENIEVISYINAPKNLLMKNNFLERIENLKIRKNNLKIIDNFLNSQSQRDVFSFTLQNFETSENNIDDEIAKANFNELLPDHIKEIIFNSPLNFSIQIKLLTRSGNLFKRKNNLLKAKSYFDLSNIKNTRNFNKVDQITIDNLALEIAKIDDYDSLSEAVKTIVDHQENQSFRSALQTRLDELKTRKRELEAVKSYFDLQNIIDADSFNKADQETIDALDPEIAKINNKINDYDSLSDDIKKIVDHEDNSEFKDALQTKLQTLQNKKSDLEKAKIYFDLSDVSNTDTFNKADQTTIDALILEIAKIDNYDLLSEDVKLIINNENNIIFKNALQTNLKLLRNKKKNLEKAKIYFDLSDVADASIFNIGGINTIKDLELEITKISDFDSLPEAVKMIINHQANKELRYALEAKLISLRNKKVILQKTQTYFDLSDVADVNIFNKADQTTIDVLYLEIFKINDYDLLSSEVQAIVNHEDNAEFKNALEIKLNKLQNKWSDLEAAQTYFDLQDVENADNFNKADQKTLDALNSEIAKINNYDTLSETVKAIVNHPDNQEFKNALEAKLEAFQNKKVYLEEAQTYFDLSEILEANTFNKADQTTIDNLDPEIAKINNKINEYNSLSEDYKANLNQEFKEIFENVSQIKLISLQNKKTDLEKAKTYFDLSNVNEVDGFKADQETLDALDSEIAKINDYDTLSETVQAIVNHEDNYEFKNPLEAKLNSLQNKKSDLEKAKTYFDLSNVNEVYGLKVDQETLDALNLEIAKINDYDTLSETVKTIVNHEDNLEFKNALQTKLVSLQNKKSDLEKAKIYFDLSDVSNADIFNKIDQTTIDALALEITKINDYDTLSQTVKAIVDHVDNSEFKEIFENVSQTKLVSLQNKKSDLEAAQIYFDLSNVEDADTFNKSDQTTIDALDLEITKINDYDTLIETVKVIVDHQDNSEFKNALETKLVSLQNKKSDLEKVKTYFDLQDVENADTFNKADQTTIDALDPEIAKINNYDALSETVKAIVNHVDNVEFKNALQTRLETLQNKKSDLEKAKTYFDLSNVNEVYGLKVDQETLDKLASEIAKINDYDTLPETVKAIVNHEDNLKFKNALQTKLVSLQDKKSNLEAAQTYFDLSDVEDADTFNKADQETIDALALEILKVNDYNSLPMKIQIIVYYLDNAELRNALETRLETLQNKKSDLEKAKTYFNLSEILEANIFNKADQTKLDNLDLEILKINNKINDYDSLSDDVKKVIDHEDNSQFKDALQTRLQTLQNKKSDLEKAKNYFDLSDVKDADTFNKADQTTIDLLDLEIAKINDYDTLSQTVKVIVDHVDNAELKNTLETKLVSLQSKKADLEKAKTYFDLQDVIDVNAFNKADQTTIDALDSEIAKLVFNANLYEKVKAIVDHLDNKELKDSFEAKLVSLQIKKNDLGIAKTYFDLQDVSNADTFNKADQETIDALNSEIAKINDYDTLSQTVKVIVDHEDNLEFKNALQTKLVSLQSKKSDLEKAKTYFDLQDVIDVNTFNKVDQTTIDALNSEIAKINDYDTFSQKVKAIVNHEDNAEFRSALQTKLETLQNKKSDLERTQIYFDLQDVKNADIFNKADHETLDALDLEIAKINDYDTLSQKVQAIVNHEDNSEFRSALQTKLETLQNKKSDLERTQIYFDLQDVENADTFNKADQETLDVLTLEIAKINDYDTLSQKVKAIVDHEDNSEFKNALETKLISLQNKKSDLEKAKTYFDFQDVENADTFNKADQETLDALNLKITKIKDYDALPETVKAIVDHENNLEFKNALQTRLETLQNKKPLLEKAIIYFDLSEILEANAFNKIDQTTLYNLDLEIVKINNKINNYDSLSDDVKKVVDHEDNAEFKDALQTRLKTLQDKKSDIEVAQTYFDLQDVSNADTFNKVDQETLDALNSEITKINDYDTLSETVKAIVDHEDNSEFKNALETKLVSLQSKKSDLENAKTYFDLADVKDLNTFNKADQETLDALNSKIAKINDYDTLSQTVKAIVDHENNLEFKNALQTKLVLLQDKKSNLLKAKTYFDLSEIFEANIFNKADQTTLDNLDLEITKINNKINDYDSLSDDVKKVVDHEDNSEFKNALQTRLETLQNKKSDLEKTKIYFDLSDVENADTFNKVDQTTIDALDLEIAKINDYDVLSEKIKAIVDHVDNSEFKNALQTRLNQLQNKKSDLEKAKTYFDLADVKDLNTFNKADQETLDALNSKITKIKDYDALPETVKAIVDHENNQEFKDPLQTRLEILQNKKSLLEKAKTYFDLSEILDADALNKADQTTLNNLDLEIAKINNKINDYDILSEAVKTIVDHEDNSEFKNALQTRLETLQNKKPDLEKAKTYFDLSNVNEVYGLQVDQETLDKLASEIAKINDYDTLPETVKAIVDHEDNLKFKNALQTKLVSFQNKKSNLEVAQTYFDLSDVEDADTFNKADQTTIDALALEILKVNDYNSLPMKIKIIVYYLDNTELRIALETRLETLKNKKSDLEKAKIYFDLSNVNKVDGFEPDQTTFDALNSEIAKINDYDTLPETVKAIVDHEDNSEFKNALQTKLVSLQNKKSNLLKAKTYFDLSEILEANTFNKADQTTLDNLDSEITKINNKINDYDSLSDDVKAIVNHQDNLKFKNALQTRLETLQNKKSNLLKAKTYFDLSEILEANTFNKLDQTTLDALVLEIAKINNKINDYDVLSQTVKTIVDHVDNAEFKNALQTRLNQLQNKKSDLEKAKIYFDLSEILEANNFNKADQDTIDALTLEIAKINDYDTLTETVKVIVDHEDNTEFKNALEARLNELQNKKFDLETIFEYFDLINVKKENYFDDFSSETENELFLEIDKINNYDELSDNLKQIVDHEDNQEFKNKLKTRLDELEKKQQIFNLAKTYFDLSEIQKASLLNKTDQTTIDILNSEIAKINQKFFSFENEDDLIIKQKLENLLNTKLLILTTKRNILIQGKKYFDDIDILNPNDFNIALEIEINKFNEKIVEIDNFEILAEEVKAIINHSDNHVFKELSDQKILNLYSKKSDLEKAKTYFDLSNVENANTFNKADQTTLDALTLEIAKINDYDILTETVKVIVDHVDNSEFKNALEVILDELKTRKIYLQKAKNFLDLSVNNPSDFVKADQEEVDKLSSIIDQMVNFDSLEAKTKEIINNQENNQLFALLIEKTPILKTHKEKLEIAKNYFAYFNDINANNFNKVDQETLDALNDVITRINDHASLGEDVENIIKNSSNSSLLNDLDDKLKNLETKETNLEIVKNYFDLSDVKNADTFNKADQTTIDNLDLEITKINQKKVILDDEVEKIFDASNESTHSTSSNSWNDLYFYNHWSLNYQSYYYPYYHYFGYPTVYSQSYNTDNTKEEDLQILKDQVQEIIDHLDNAEFKNALQTRLETLQNKKTDLEKAKTYFDLSDLSNEDTFNKADQETLDALNSEIAKINDYDTLSQTVQAIINHENNLEFKNTLETKLVSLQNKKSDLEKAKTYFDLSNIAASDTFNKADQETVETLDLEIIKINSKINDYDTLSLNVKTIVDHADNSELKDALETKLTSLKEKKTNLQIAIFYFDLSGVGDAENFNKADQDTIDALNSEIVKIDYYDSFLESIIKPETEEQIDFFEVLQAKIDLLSDQELSSEDNQIFNNLLSLKNVDSFNKIDQETIDAINIEIVNIRKYEMLSDSIKLIVNYEKDIIFKNILETKLQALIKKQNNLNVLIDYFNSHQTIKESSYFNKDNYLDQVTGIDQEIDKIDYQNNLNEDLKSIIDHEANNDKKVMLLDKLQTLQTRKLELISLEENEENTSDSGTSDETNTYKMKNQNAQILLLPKQTNNVSQATLMVSSIFILLFSLFLIYKILRNLKRKI